MFKWLGKALDAPKSRAASRLCGVTGWMGVITLQFTSFFMQLPLPESYEMFLITCAALTGVEILEGIVSAFKGTVPREFIEEPFVMSEPTCAAGGGSVPTYGPASPEVPYAAGGGSAPTYAAGGGSAPTYEDLTGRPL